MELRSHIHAMRAALIRSVSGDLEAVGAERKVGTHREKDKQSSEMQSWKKKGDWNKEKGGALGRFVGALWV